MAKGKRSIKIDDVAGLILGIVIIIVGILMAIFKNQYFVFMTAAIGIVLVATGAYRLAMKKYLVEILLIVSGSLLIFFIIYDLTAAMILFGVAIFALSIFMLIVSIKAKEKKSRATLSYLIFILGLLAGSIIIAASQVDELWLFIFFGVALACDGLLITLKSV